eukprot:TRINITY_DN14512_c0_g1_i1.p1 TRINITY_DN14512_c0_g1~~TRINITY_DN14512_c0_g1_i1.p1  ORF type:complete len:621 (+),score=152.46 TRINITY_DN14512_c0_g1_i1:138-2000(+)
MGQANSGGGCGCCDGLRRQFGGRNGRPQVRTMAEALRLERDRCGSWASPVPTPSVCGDRLWEREISPSAFSSPKDRRRPSPSMDGIAMTIEEYQSLDEEPHIVERKPERMLDAGLLKPFSRERSFGLEQLICSPGSLPSGLPPDRRHASPTATRELLSKVPRQLLTQRGAAGQKLRLKMLNNATIVFFTAGYEGKRFVYEKAHSLGIKSVIIDDPSSWSRSLVAEGIIAKFIPVDMSKPSDAVYQESLAAIQALRQDPLVGEADGVATVVELSVPTAARLAEALGLPGALPEAVDLARDKRRTRQTMKEARLPTPAYAKIASPADILKAGQLVGFPAVLKPVSGAASLGVKKVETEAELEGIYHELITELRSLVVSSGALVKGDNNKGVQADGVIGTVFILEQYLDGDEVDVDIVMSEGEWRYAAVSDNGPTLEPYFNETWAVTPSLLPKPKQKELKELAINSVKCLGFTEGVFHVELKYTKSRGPHLIEVNARMGGGPVYATNLKTWNVDLVEEMLLCCVGIPSRPDVPKEPLCCIANTDVNTLTTGILANMDFLAPLKDRQDVISYSPHVQAGERIVGPADGLPTWLVEIVVSRPTSREALDFLLKLEAEVQALVKLM